MRYGKNKLKVIKEEIEYLKNNGINDFFDNFIDDIINDNSSESLNKQFVEMLKTDDKLVLRTENLEDGIYEIRSLNEYNNLNISTYDINTNMLCSKYSIGIELINSVEEKEKV